MGDGTADLVWNVNLVLLPVRAVGSQHAATTCVSVSRDKHHESDVLGCNGYDGDSGLQPCALQTRNPLKPTALPSRCTALVVLRCYWKITSFNNIFDLNGGAIPADSGARYPGRKAINNVVQPLPKTTAGVLPWPYHSRMLDFGQFDFGQFDFGQLAEIELAEVEIGRSRN